jgi:hypothetical protein
MGQGGKVSLASTADADILDFIIGKLPDEKDVEKTFWLTRPDGWVINKKTKRIIMFEFKRTSATAQQY